MNEWLDKCSRRVIVLNNVFNDFFWIFNKRESCQKVNNMLDKFFIRVELINRSSHTNIELFSELLPKLVFAIFFFFLMSIDWSFSRIGWSFWAFHKFLSNVDVVDDTFNSLLPLFAYKLVLKTCLLPKFLFLCDDFVFIVHLDDYSGRLIIKFQN